jgi:hypothetical protein
MSAIAPFPQPIHRYLREFVARSRRVRLARAALVAVAYVLAWTLIVAVIDRLTAMPGWVRGALLAAEGAAVVGILARPIRDALRRRVDWVEASAQVERRNPAMGQRLVTVTSQLLAPAEYRGSGQMLDALVSDVAGEVETQRGGRLVTWRSVGRPMVAVALLVAGTAGLWGVEWLDLPQLIGRQLRPLDPIPPVTTTHVQVTPEGARVKDHDSLVVRAIVQHLGPGPAPRIHLAGDRGRWDAVPMTQTADDAYTFTIAAVEQDQRFYVTAGDARTPVYDVRVLRRPAVAEFRVRYTYPAYTLRAGLGVRNTDGLIEAPRGSQAVVQVVATEPLASATLVFPGRQRTAMQPTAAPNVRQATLTIEKDQPLELEMTSDRGVDGRGPKGMRVRAVPDRPPLVRMLQPAGDVRLSQRDLLPIAYQALDDYGVAQLSIQAQVNGNPPVKFPRRIKGDPRRVEGTSELDLAGLGAKVGDVVSVTMVAVDRAGQPATSDARHVLVSPRSIDMTTHQRMAELSQAAAYAREWAAQLTRAQEALGRARRAGKDAANDDGDGAAAVARVGQWLAASQEVGAALRQVLLRAIVYGGSPKMSDAIALAIDAVTVQLDGAERVDEAVAARRGVDDAVAARMARTVASASQLAGRVKELADGDQAAAVLADRANVRGPAGIPPAGDAAARERRAQAIARATQDITAALAALGIDPKSPRVDAELQKRIDAARLLVDAARPVDFAAAATRWAAAVRDHEPQPPHLDERLLVASQAEAVRPDPGLVAAKDLQLAARAATALASPPAADADAGAAESAQARTQALVQYPAALTALRAAHDVYRRAARATTPADARRVHAQGAAIRAAAAAAREKMAGWASAQAASPDELAARARELEELATAANAATEDKAFDQAAELDRQMAAAAGRPDLADAAAGPRQIDRLSNAQERIADQTAAATDDRAAAAFAGAQRQVADQIGDAQVDPWADPAATPDAAESRQRATEAISRAQEKLASVPMQLSTAGQLAQSVAETSSRLRAAEHEAASAPEARQESAQRVAGMIKSELAEARQSFDAALKPLGDRAADELVESLRPFTPDTSLAVTSVEEYLKEALADLRGALSRSTEGGDRAGVEVASQRVRDAVAQAQDALRDAQAQVIERDPLVSARWFARAAADALASAPPNKPTAVAHQRKTLEALSKAAAEALRRSKNARLSQVPGYAPLYLPPAAGGWNDADGRFSGERFLPALPGMRDWGRLRERPGEAVDAPVRESEPPGYGDALRTYFEVLGKEDVRPGEGK